ncbi:MAG: hypothetical protein WA825_06700 [Steroidobacteraceae bacterium]
MRRQVLTLTKLLRRVGILATLMFVADSLLTRLCKARILLVILRERDQILRERADLPAGFTAAVRTAEQMCNVDGFCGGTLTAEFLSDAIKRHDRCLVILDNGEVVNFQWLSDGLTLAFDDIWIGFGPGYLYGYNSLTAPSHRGKGLNRCAVPIAGQLLAAPAGKGLAGYIDATNVASILSQWNPANQHLGIALVWPRAKKRLWVLASRRCRAGQLTFARR